MFSRLVVVSVTSSTNQLVERLVLTHVLHIQNVRLVCMQLLTVDTGVSFFLHVSFLLELNSDRLAYNFHSSII